VAFVGLDGRACGCFVNAGAGSGPSREIGRGAAWWSGSSGSRVCGARGVVRPV